MPFPPPSWKDQLEELAQVLGKEDVSQKLINDYWQRIEELKQFLGDSRHTMQVSVASASSENLFWAYGEKHLTKWAHYELKGKPPGRDARANLEGLVETDNNFVVSTQGARPLERLPNHRKPYAH